MSRKARTCLVERMTWAVWDEESDLRSSPRPGSVAVCPPFEDGSGVGYEEAITQKGQGGDEGDSDAIIYMYMYNIRIRKFSRHI